MLKYLNYLMIAFFTSSLSISCFKHINNNHIEDMNKKLKTLQEENETLRKDIKPSKDLKNIISNIDDCLTLLMREIIESDIDTIDEPLREEINSICTRIIDTIPKKPLTLEIVGNGLEESYEEEPVIQLQREKNESSDSLSSNDSFDNISTNGGD